MTKNKVLGENMNAREVAVYALIDILEQQSYNNLTLKKFFNDNKDIKSQDRAFITELVNGTLRNIIFIDYIINSFSNTKTNKMKPLILNILRISVYQIKFMEKVPVSAICNEAVSFTKKKKFNGLSGFVNAVLRNIARNIDSIILPDEQKEPVKFLAIKYSYEQGYDFFDVFGTPGDPHTDYKNLAKLHDFKRKFGENITRIQTLDTKCRKVKPTIGKEIPNLK